MKIRDYLNQNSSVGILAAVVLLVISLFIIYRQLTGSGGGPRITELYYYDLNTGRVFVAPIEAVPPIETDSGDYQGEPAGVRANIFACGSCRKSYAGMTPEEIESAGADLAYLQKYPPDAKAAIERSRSGEAGQQDYLAAEQELYSAVYEDEWYHVYEDAEQIGQLTQIDLDCPEDKRPKVCFPGRQ